MASEERSRSLSVFLSTLSARLKGNPLLSACKGLEVAIRDNKKNYKDKVSVLLSVWESFMLYVPSSTTNITDKLFEFIYRYTLLLVLEEKWGTLSKIFKNHLLFEVEKCCIHMTRQNCRHTETCIYLQNIIHRPWDIKVLRNVIGNRRCLQIEIDEFFSKETLVLLAARLEIMIEARTEDLAERLAMRCLDSFNNITLSDTAQLDVDTDFNLIHDLCLYILWMNGRKKTFLAECLSMTLVEGMALIDRCYMQQIGIGRSRRLLLHCHPVAEAAANCIILKVLHTPLTVANRALLHSAIEKWATIKHINYSSKSACEKQLKSLLYDTDSYGHIYIICDVVYRIFGDELKSLCVELYIRALTLNQNEVFYYEEAIGEKNEIKEAEMKMSVGILSLANMFKAHVALYRECILTAFSLNPSMENYERVRQLAVDSNLIDTGQYIPEPPYYILRSSNVDNDKGNPGSLINMYLRLITKSKGYDVLSAPCDMLDSDIGLRKEVIYDLILVLTVSRNHMLSWVLEFSKLDYMCRMYMARGGEMWSRELRYLKIDYEQFRNRPCLSDLDEEGENYGQSDEEYVSSTDSSSSYVRKKRKKTKDPDASVMKTYRNCCMISDASRPRRSKRLKGRTISGSSETCSDNQTKTSNVEEHDVIVIESSSEVNYDDDDDDISTNDDIPATASKKHAVSDDETRPRPGIRRSCSDLELDSDMCENRINKKMKKLSKTFCKRRLNKNLPNEKTSTNKTVIDRDIVCDTFQAVGSCVSSMSDLEIGSESEADSVVSIFKKQVDIKTPQKHKYLSETATDSDYETQKISEHSGIGFRGFDSVSEIESLCSDDGQDKSLMKSIIRISKQKGISLGVCENKSNVIDVDNDVHPTNNDPIYDKMSNRLTTAVNWNPRVVLHDVLSNKLAEGYDVNNSKNGIKTNSLFNKHSVGSTENYLKNGVNILFNGSGILNLNAKTANCGLLSDDDLSKTVPGLTSLDMIVPPMTESTIHVVQLQDHLTPTSTPLTVLQNTRPSVSSQSETASTETVQTVCLASKDSRQASNQNKSSLSANSSSGGSGMTGLPQLEIGQNSISSSAVNTEQQSPVFLNANNAPQTVSSNAQISYSHEPLLTVQSSAQVARPSSSQSASSSGHIESSTAASRLIQNNNIHSSSLVQSQGSLQWSSPLVFSVQPTSPYPTLKLIYHTGISSNNSPVKVAEENAKPAADTPVVTEVTKLKCETQSQEQQKPDQKPEKCDQTESHSSPTIESNISRPATDVEQTVGMVSPGVSAEEESDDEEMNIKFFTSSKRVANVPKYQPSLPKFQQAFGKTMYQSNTTNVQVATTSSNNESGEKIADNNSVFSMTHAPTSAIETASSLPVCTVLSKAVQTSKEPDSKSTKCSTATDTNGGIENVNQKNTTSTTARSIQNNIDSQNACLSTQPGKAHERTGIIQSTAGVIFPCKVSTAVSNSNLIQRKPAPNLKPSLTHFEESRPKETVIHRNINALLAAALSSCSSTPGTCSNNESPTVAKVSTVPSGSATNQVKAVVESEKKKPEASVQTALPTASVERVTLPNIQKNVRRQPVLQPSKFTRPLVQISSGTDNQNQVTSAVVALNRNVQAVINANSRAARNDALITHSAIEKSVSSKTLEQLREFESVLEQVTNTSQMKERNTVQSHSSGLESLNEPIIIPQTSASSSEFTTDQSSAFRTSTSNTVVQDLQGQRLSVTFISQSTSSTSNNTLISTGNPKITSNTPVVVVQSCNRPVSSVLSSSPVPSTVTTNTTIGKITMKTSKTTKSKTAIKTNPSTATLKVSTLQKPQQKPQEDEQTTQRIYAILDKYAEQLRNSPELKNKPAPRRRSNPPTNPSPTSKRKKSTQTKSKLPSHQASCSSSGMEMSPGSEDVRTIGSEDSSNGVSQISQVMNSPQNKDDNAGGDLSSETSESLDAKDTRVQHKVVLTDASPVQNRAVIMQDNIQSTVINVEGTKVVRKQVVVGGTAAMPLISLSNVPGTAVRQVLFPVSTDGRLVLSKVPKMYRVHQVTMPSGSPLILQPMCMNKPGSNVKQLKSSVISGISSQSLTGVSAQPAVVLPSEGQFTLSSEHSVEASGSIGINLDNTVLLNATSAPSLLTTTTATAQLTQIAHINRTNQSGESSTLSFGNEMAVACLKSENILSLSSILPVISTSSDVEEKLAEKKNVALGDSQLTCLSPLNYKQTNNASSQEYIASCLENSEDESSIVSQQHKQEEDSGVFGDNNNNGNDNEADNSTENRRKSNWSVITSTSKSSVVNKEYSSSSVKQISLIQNQESFVSKTESATGIESRNENACSSPLSSGIKTDLDGVKSELDAIKSELDCEDSVSSDSASSGRVKSRQLESKTRLLPGATEDTDSPWRYTVTKLGSPKERLEASQRTSLQSIIDHPIISNRSRTTCFKRKSSENTIYQVAFRRNERLQANSKERDSMAHRNLSLEGELRLQKSLSEECEDLGVDEPSTSDLFPEAELLLDPDPSSRDSHPDMPAGSFCQNVESSSNSSSSPVLHDPPSKRRSYNRIRTDVSKINSGGHSLLMSRKGVCSDIQKSESSGNSTPVNGGSTESYQDEFQMTSEAEEKSSDENGGKDKDDDAELTSAWDEESVCLGAIHEESSVQNSNSSFLNLANPAAGPPFTYSNRNSFLLSRKRKADISWETSLKQRLGTKEDVDSDTSELHERDACTTDEELFSEADYRPINGLNESEDYMQQKNSESSSKAVNILNETRNSSDSSSQSPPSVSIGMPTCSAGGLAGFTLSARRSSLRGHVKKGCPCCNGSPEPSKKKKDGKDIKFSEIKTEKIVNFSSPNSRKTQNNKTVFQNSAIKKR